MRLRSPHLKELSVSEASRWRVVHYKDKMCTVHKSDKNNVSINSVGEYYVKENGYCDLGKREDDMVWTVM